MSNSHGRPHRKIGLGTACALAFVSVVGLGNTGTAGPSGFRCPTTGRLISTDQSLLEVRKKCREPDEARSSVELRTVREKVRRWVNGVALEESLERTVEVPVDEWTYDFGPSRFIEYLRFEYGRLISIREGGKGITDPE